MVNGNDIVLWSYLLDPAFQIVNTAGKPLTEGYIEVYLAGTRDKYYCASDFDGTLHPFQIPLDSLGSNVVLANPDQAYDIYIYNRFGSLIMSRYNVSAGHAGGGALQSITITSTDGTVDIVHDGSNYDLSIKDTVERVDSLESQLDNLGNESDYSVAYGYGESGEFVLTDKATSGITYLNDSHGWRLKPGHVYQLNYNAKFTCDDKVNTVVEGKFYLDGNLSFSQDWNFTLDDSFDYTQCYNGSTLIVVPSTLKYYDLKLKYTFTSVLDCQVDLENISIVDITSITSIGGGSTYVEGDGINIHNDIISVDMDYINSQLNIETQICSAINISTAYTNEVLNDYTTHTDVYNSIATAITEANNYTDNSINEVMTIIEGATGDIQAVSANIKQSDWTQTDDTQIDYIKHKPEEIEVDFIDIKEGDNIDISISGNTATISADLSNCATHSEVYSATSTAITSANNYTDTQINNLNIDQYTTHSEVYSATSSAINSSNSYTDTAINNLNINQYATHNEVYNSSVTAINSANSYTDTAIANIDLTPAVEIVSPNNTISVSSTIDQVHNTKTFYIDTNEPDTNYWIGEARVQLADTSSQGTVGYYKDIFNYAERSKGNLDATKLKKGLYLLTGCIMGGVTDIVDERIEYQICSYSTSAICGANLIYQHDASLENGYGEDSNQSHSFATLVDIKYDDTPMSLVARMNEPTTITTKLNLYFSDLCLYELKGASIGGGSSPAASGSYEDGWGIVINGNVISVNPSIIPDTSNFATHNEVITYASSAINVANDYTDTAINNLNVNQYATHNEVYNSTVSAINSATAIIPDVSDMATQTWVNIQGFLTEVPSGYATTNYVDNSIVSAINIATGVVPEQVQSDWTEDDDTDPSYIQHKPEIEEVDFCPIIAGSGVSITASGDSAIISCTATANVPAQVQSDWAQTASGSVDFIKNKPEEVEVEFTDVVAGSGITITASGTTAIISCTVTGGGGGTTYTPGTGIDITNNTISIDNTVALKTDIPDVSDMATKTWVGNQGYLTSVPSQYITETELSSELNDYALKTDIPDPVSGASGVKVEDNIVSLDNPVGLCAGENITITVSGNSAIIAGQAGGSSYTEGTGIDITNNVISVDTSTIATQTWVGQQGYLTSIPSTYATDSEVQTVEAHVQIVSAAIPDTSDMATKTWVGNQGYLTSIPSTYATDVEVTQAVTGATQNMVSYTGNTAINHVQLVSTLPGSPDANTLYLIPEA